MRESFKNLESLPVAVSPLARGLCLAPMLGVHHLAELQKPSGTDTGVMNQRKSDHTNRWIHVTRLLGAADQA